ncbi:thioredoxin family protein [Dermatobacter hominis]|uniref:thioredoxin family protein n=1 Tax=Dermatobacter hominis TaxID=2884263 RepID=UPI001D0F51BD|nr:thioredoxin family protein [Dermatobacter hominis]UDY34150.1 thioredoxin family protein [Dermatobacter hominis]
MSTTHDPTTPSAASVDRLTSTSFDEEVMASDRPVLVDFTASWCPPCEQQTPVLHALADEQAARLRIVEVDVDESPDLARRHQVLSAPTMVLYVDGRIALTLVGARGRGRLLEDLDPFLG